MPTLSQLRRRAASRDERVPAGWDHGTLLALSAPRCRWCRGSGVWRGHACKCVQRGVARLCLSAYHRYGASIGVRIRERDQPVLIGHVRSSGRYEMAECDYRADIWTHAIAALPAEYREVFRLHCIDGLEAPDVARLLGLPEGRTWSRIYRAQELVGAALQAARLKPDEYFGGTRH